MYLRTIILFTLLNLGCTQNIPAQQVIRSSDEPLRVSIVKLLISPDDYHGKKVLVEGFLHSKFEDSAVYFSKEHGDYLMNSEAIWLNYDSTLLSNIDLKDYDEQYVSILGIFDKEHFGHMGSFAGTIKVESINKLKKWYK